MNPTGEGGNMKGNVKYTFGNLHFGGQLTEEFLGGENMTEEKREEFMIFAEAMSKSWNKALRGERNDNKTI